jgi:hypothetical protein
MQEPTPQTKPQKTIHIGYVIAAIIIIIVAVVCAIIFWPSPGPVTPTPTPTPIVTTPPTPTPISNITVSIATTTASKSAKYFNVSVNISQISNFAGSSCDIKYDPKVITVYNISTGSINGAAVPLENWAYIPSSTQGTVRIVTLDPSLSGINGEGYLCTIRFQVVSSAVVGSSSAISFIKTSTDPESNLRLGDVNGNEIPSTWINGSVTIQ